MPAGSATESFNDWIATATASQIRLARDTETFDVTMRFERTGSSYAQPHYFYAGTDGSALCDMDPLTLTLTGGGGATVNEALFQSQNSGPAPSAIGWFSPNPSAISSCVTCPSGGWFEVGYTAHPVVTYTPPREGVSRAVLNRELPTDRSYPGAAVRLLVGVGGSGWNIDYVTSSGAHR